MHLFQVNLKMNLTYRTVPYDEDFDVQEPEGGITEAGGSPKSKHHNRKPWDDDCPWSEWYSAEDPVKGNYVSESNNCINYISCYRILSELIRGSDMRPS